MQGETVSHYQIRSELGRGTYGAVYEAVHIHDHSNPATPFLCVWESLLDVFDWFDRLRT